MGLLKKQAIRRTGYLGEGNQVHRGSAGSRFWILDAGFQKLYTLYAIHNTLSIAACRGWAGVLLCLRCNEVKMVFRIYFILLVSLLLASAGSAGIWEN